MSVLNPTYQELLDRVDELELSVTENDKRMQKVYAENESMQRKVHELMSVKQFPFTRHKEDNYRPAYYFSHYENHSREDLILEIMRLRITLLGMTYD